MIQIFGKSKYFFSKCVGVSKTVYFCKHLILNRFVMCTVLVTYNPSNKAASNLMYALSKTRGVKIDDEAILTDDEIIRIEESRRSGILYDVDKLKEKLRS